MSVNDNATYHLAELDGIKLVVPIAGMRLKILKKRRDREPNRNDLDKDEGEEMTSRGVNDDDEEMSY